jgi:predicted NBD/HSP70 family sugar kinase
MRKGQSPFLEWVSARRIRDEHVVAGAHAGDEACLRIVSRAGEALGQAIAGATNLINPELIVIGGRVGGEAGHLLTQPVREAVEAHTFPLATDTLLIESSENAYVAGVSGAASTVIEGLLTGNHLTSWQTELEGEAG